MRYGYIRVSTREQNIDRQLTAILKEEIDKNHIFIDKASGKDFERTNYKRLLRKLRAGDELVIKSIDRLGRNYDEIIEQWRLLVKKKQVDISVLDFPLLNTRNGIENVTGKLISDLVLQILSYVSQIEREQIQQRQKEGIAEAMKKGVRFGRPKLEKPCLFDDIAQAYQNGEISVREGAKVLNVPKSTFHNWLKDENYCPKE
ncbi:resolvase [Streptococcus suis]|nr:resolvase [Streptococcus suis]KPA68379.1 resolvase [Streptococcus suis]